MFVRSRLSKDIVYRKRGKDWVIKAGTVTYIDENQVSAQELRKLYSTRIEIMSRERLEAIEKEIPIKEEIEKIQGITEVQVDKSKKEEKVRTIDEILTEIKKEEVKPVIKVEIVNPIKDALMTDAISGNLVHTPQPAGDIEPLEPVHAILEQPVDTLTLEPVHAILEQPVEIKKEEPPEETGKEIPVLDEKGGVEKPKKVSKASSKKPNGKRRGRTKKATAK